MARKTVDKRVGGMKRAEKARALMSQIMADEVHPMRYAKDIDYAKAFDVSRHTVYKMRRDLNIPDRPVRILNHLRKLDTSKYTMKELCALLNVKYAGLYKIVTENKLSVRPDPKPPPRRCRKIIEVT